MPSWTFTITHTRAGFTWTVHHGARLHAAGTAGDYNTAWLDSHDAIPDRTILTERRYPAPAANPTSATPLQR